MKTYTLTYKSSQEDSGRLVVVIDSTSLQHVIAHARQKLSELQASMPECEELTYTIYRNGELVWEESFTK